MEIEQIISYIVVGLTSLSTVIAWVASCIKSVASNKKAIEMATQLKEEVKETKSYKELKAIIQDVLEDNKLLKEQLNETMAELTRVRKDYRREKKKSDN